MPIRSEVISCSESTAKVATASAAVDLPLDRYVNSAKLVHSKLMNTVTPWGGGWLPSAMPFDITNP